MAKLCQKNHRTYDNVSCSTISFSNTGIAKNDTGYISWYYHTSNLMCQCHGSTKACIRPPPVSSVPLLEQLLCPMSSEHGSSAQPSVRVSTRIATGPPHSIPIVCKFHVGGFCANGDSCRFLHPSLDGRDADSQSTTQTASISSVSSLSFAPPSVTNFVKTVSQRDVGQASPSRHSSTTQNQNQQDDGGHGYVDFADAYASIFQDGGHVDGEDCSEQFSTLSVNSSGNHDFVTNLDAVHARSSYAGAAGSNLPRDATSISPTRYRWEHVNENFASDFVTFESILCKYHMDGTCKYGQNCMYLHGTFCSTCRKNSLHPTDNAKAAKHVAECAADETMRARIQASTTVDCGTWTTLRICPDDRHCYCLCRVDFFDSFLASSVWPSNFSIWRSISNDPNFRSCIFMT